LAALERGRDGEWCTEKGKREVASSLSLSLFAHPPAAYTMTGDARSSVSSCFPTFPLCRSAFKVFFSSSYSYPKNRYSDFYFYYYSAAVANDGCNLINGFSQFDYQTLPLDGWWFRTKTEVQPG